jgi:hypothetical protein
LKAACKLLIGVSPEKYAYHGNNLVFQVMLFKEVCFRRKFTGRAGIKSL